MGTGAGKDVRALAVEAAAWLFPDGPDEQPEDLQGSASFDSRAAIEDALTAMPRKTLEALAAAPKTYALDATIQQIGHEALCWLRAMLPEPYDPDDGARTMPLRDLGNLLAFSDLNEAVAAHDPMGQYDAGMALLVESYEEPDGNLRAYGKMPVSPSMKTPLGYLHATAKELEKARAFALWYLLLMRIFPRKLEDETFRIIRANLNEPERVAHAVLSRRTMDPTVLRAVLESDNAPLAEGLL